MYRLRVYTVQTVISSLGGVQVVCTQGVQKVRVQVVWYKAGDVVQVMNTVQRRKGHMMLVLQCTLDKLKWQDRDGYSVHVVTVGKMLVYRW